jgi:hypothetical protein
MFKFVSTFVVLALFSAGAAQPTFAKQGKATQKHSTPAPRSVDAAKFGGKPVKGISDVHEQYEKPVNRHGGCDRNMGGCIEH